MLANNGPQLAHGMHSVVAHNFYKALSRWSRIECPSARDRAGQRTRGYAGEATAKGIGSPATLSRSERHLRHRYKYGTPVDENIFESSGIWGQEGWQTSTSKGGDVPELREESSKIRRLQHSSVRSNELQDGRDQALRHDLHPNTSKFTEEESSKAKTSTQQKRSQLHTSKNLSAPTERASKTRRPATSDQSHTNEQALHLAENVRRVMRVVANTVAVITTTAKPITQVIGAHRPQEVKNYISDFRGMTISSFTTVSLNPEPIISFNIRTPSSTLDAIRSTRHFMLNLLCLNTSGYETAQAFTKGNASGTDLSDYPQSSPNFWKLTGPADLNGKVRTYLPTPMGGVKCSFRCLILSKEDRAKHGGGDGIIEVGDHVIILARVTGVHDRPLPTLNTSSVLCYQNGEYVGTERQSFVTAPKNESSDGEKTSVEMSRSSRGIRDEGT